MATRPDHYAYEARLDDFLAVVRHAQGSIAAQVRLALASGDLRSAARRRMQLAAIQATLDQLGAEIDRTAAQLVADAYAQGADRVLTQIGATITATEIPGAFSSVSIDAVRTLQDSILGRLTAARQTVGRTIEDTYARAGRRAALRAVLGADNSPRIAARNLAHDLMRDRDVARAVRDGGTGFVDKTGRRWGLDTYTEMVVRTTTREAVVQGALARMASHQIDLARVSEHASSCKLCAPWEGRLVSLDGHRSEYHGESVTDLASLPNGGPPFHPNCRHSLAPVAVKIDALRQQLAGAGA